MSNFIISAKHNLMVVVDRMHLYKIKHENDKVYSLYECPHNKWNQWHECIALIRDEYVKQANEIAEKLLLEE